MTIGRFRCDVGCPSFRDTGPIRNAVVVFPRTSVWIRHEGGQPFVADPTVVTIYNRAQRYERFAISPEGDHCDWFAVSEPLAREIAAAWRPESGDVPDRPFRDARAAGTAELYAAQRALQRRAASGRASALELEEKTIGVVSEVMRLAAGAAVPATPVVRRVRDRAASRRRELAEAARALLAATAREHRSVSELAAELGTSPFHLCRVFRAETGQTLHAYRVALRVRAAISMLDASEHGARASLSAVAHAAGFASHAHFVRICRAALGCTPAVLRARLA
ncbi:MAG: helix-turn-helix transcriptional regulator [Gemmatimonadetes bacterium]|nr:helix-turn-helix transcriptional regulator [Gemmatimonadota bacterium]